MYELFEEFLDIVTNWSLLAFEFVGVCVLVLAGIRGVRDYFIHSPLIRLNLAEGMALALEFKLGSEILRTVIVRDISELYFIACLIILRASLTFLIHWEIDYEEKNKARDELDDLNTESLQQQNGLVSKMLNSRFSSMEKKQREKSQEKYSNSNLSAQ